MPLPSQFVHLLYENDPMSRALLSLFLSMALAALTSQSQAFVVTTNIAFTTGSSHVERTRMMMSDDFLQETPEDTNERIQELVDNHPVLLFMKGSKLFPQCGFSNTAVQILQAYDIDFHTVDVLSDQAIRDGVKAFSQWPTIPQLYIAGEFIGGSDIMIQMYQTGELGELIETAKADMME
jgi:monothiol glutaredoxin